MPSIHGVDWLRAIGRGVSTGLSIHTQLKTQERRDAARKREEARAEERLELAREAAERAQEAHEARMKGIAGDTEVNRIHGEMFSDEVGQIAEEGAAIEEQEALGAIGEGGPTGGFGSLIGFGQHIGQAEMLRREAQGAQRIAERMPPDLRNAYVRKKKGELTQRKGAYQNEANLAYAEVLARDYPELVGDGDPGAYLQGIQQRVDAGEDPGSIAEDLQEKKEELHKITVRLEGWDDLDKTIAERKRDAARVTAILAKDRDENEPWVSPTDKLNDLWKSYTGEFRKQTDPSTVIDDLDKVTFGYQTRIEEAEAAAAMEKQMPEEQERLIMEALRTRVLPGPTVKEGSPPRDYGALSQAEQAGFREELVEAYAAGDDWLKKVEGTIKRWSMDVATVSPIVSEVAQSAYMQRRVAVSRAVENKGMTGKKGLGIMAASIWRLPVRGPEDVAMKQRLLAEQMVEFNVNPADLSAGEYAKIFTAPPQVYREIAGSGAGIPSSIP
jgi:hypothetical protein